MSQLRLRKIGNSVGVVIPAEALARKKIVEGDTLILSDTPDGFRLDVYDQDVADQVEASRDVAARYRNTLRELAK